MGRSPGLAMLEFNVPHRWHRPTPTESPMDLGGMLRFKQIQDARQGVLDSKMRSKAKEAI